MRRLLLLASSLACAAPMATAQTKEGSLLDSPGCRRALESLQQAEAAGGASPQLKSAQRAAARECLGEGAAAAESQRSANAPPQSAASAPPRERYQPPISVSPVMPSRGATVPPPRTATPRPLPPSPAQRMPPIITSCDAAGCSTSDGTRLLRIGPTLHGPGGACTVNGTLVNCP